MTFASTVDRVLGVRVPDEEIPAYTAPASDADRQDLERLRGELAAMHRHEDTLLNSRLQGFLVATSLLVAAYSQFREPRFAPVAIVVAGTGLLLAALTEYILRRTARAIEWYIRTLRNLERALYQDSDRRPYDTRRNRTPRHRVRISAILAVALPRGALLLWLILLGWAAFS